jgi:hypothetical protein
LAPRLRRWRCQPAVSKKPLRLLRLLLLLKPLLLLRPLLLLKPLRPLLLLKLLRPLQPLRLKHRSNLGNEIDSVKPGWPHRGQSGFSISAIMQP